MHERPFQANNPHIAKNQAFILVAPETQDAYSPPEFPTLAFRFRWPLEAAMLWLHERKETKMSKQQTAKGRPTHRIHSVSKNGDEKAFWTELGAAWPHKDGKALNFSFTARLLEGAQIVLRLATAKKGGAQ
jgi:hypothetical protein